MSELVWFLGYTCNVTLFLPFFGTGKVQQWTLVVKCLGRNFNNSFSQHINIRYLWKNNNNDKTTRLQKASGIIKMLVPDLLGLSWLPKETTGTDRHGRGNCIKWVANEAGGAKKYMKRAQWKRTIPLNLRWNDKQYITSGQLRSAGLAPSPSSSWCIPSLLGGEVDEEQKSSPCCGSHSSCKLHSRERVDFDQVKSSYVQHGHEVHFKPFQTGKSV